MPKLKYIFITGILLLFAAIESAYCLSVKDSLLKVLQVELKNKKYDLQKEARIKKLKASARNVSKLDYPRTYQLYNTIFREYQFYQFDSSYAYVEKMINIGREQGDRYKYQESRLNLLQILVASGMFKEAYELVLDFDKEILPGKLQAVYYNSKGRFYEALSKYNNDKFYVEQYRTIAEDQFKKMRSVAPLNNFEKMIDLAETSRDSLHHRHSATFYLNFITHNGLSHHEVAMVAMRLSYYYSDADKIMFLALSAINDIRSSTKETQAILKLGEELYKNGDLKMSYECINKAISDAEFYGARGHKIDIQNVLPLIAGKTIMETERERDKFIISSLVFAVAAVIVMFILFIVFVQLKKIKVSERLINEQNDQLGSINLKLMEHTKINEEYIGFFFKKSFSYISMLENVKRKVERKIRMRKVDEALEIITAMQISKEREDLYDTLDQIFLKLLPDFIPAFNALLKPEDQIWPQKGESLNTVLRIFALIRLGIKDDQTIAGILDYSVSTIYTYKIRLKAKAIVKGEEFDKRIMDIKFINPEK